MRALIFAGLTLALAACVQPSSPQQPAPTPTPHPLGGTSWSAVEIAAQPVLYPATLEVKADGSVSGKSGCNGFAGASTATNDAIGFGPLAATKMACPDAQMQQEARYFAALDATRRYLLEGNSLRLLDAGGATVVRYTR